MKQVFEDLIQGKNSEVVQYRFSEETGRWHYTLALTNREVRLMFETIIHDWFAEPERFYHGFVLGLMVELADRYILTSNRESGFGRYDVMLEPRKQEDDGIILEFKVQDADEEKELADTVKAALEQIDRKKYDTMLVEKGVSMERIRKYGFAFRGKTVLIGGR